VGNPLWRLVAWIVSRPLVADWLIERAQRTPYTDIHGKDGSLYMQRWWLFNPYFPVTYLRQFEWFPISVRLHHIVRPDDDRHLHDHPWNCRTIILRGGYCEQREDKHHLRMRGDTATIAHNEFHRIRHVYMDGAWTLFITGRKRGSWGFKMPWREYLGIDE
jgi:hypothetical protein